MSHVGFQPDAENPLALPAAVNVQRSKAHIVSIHLDDQPSVAAWSAEMLAKPAWDSPRSKASRRCIPAAASTRPFPHLTV
jgi:hypothetical protein